MTATPFSGVKSVGRNTAFLLFNQFASLLIRLIYLFILARALAPEGYGALSYALSWYLLLLPATFLGADVVLSREIARRREAAPVLLGTTLGLRVCAAILVLGASLLLAITIEGDDYVRSLVMLLSFSLLGRSLWMWSASAFTALEETRFIPRFELTSRLLELGVLTSFLATVGPDLRGIAIIHASSWFLQGIAAVAAVSRRYGISVHWSGGGWLAVLRDGIPGAAFVMALAAFFQLPIVLFRHLDGIDPALGHFALGFQVVTYLLTIPYVVANASLPVLSRSAIRKDGKDRIAVFLLSAIILVGGAAFASAGSLVAGPLVISLFGSNYAAASIVLSQGLWLLIPGSFAMLMQQVLFSTSVRSTVAAMAPLVGVAAMSALFPVLVRYNGPAGALWSVAVGLLIWFACTSTILLRTGFFRRRMRPASWPAGDVGRP